MGPLKLCIEPRGQPLLRVVAPVRLKQPGQSSKESFERPGLQRNSPKLETREQSIMLHSHETECATKSGANIDSLLCDAVLVHYNGLRC